MTCEFNAAECSSNCKKYSMCSFFAIQNQLSNVQTQINFIYDTMSKILKNQESADTKINLLESALFTFVNDSGKYINKESKNEENK